MRQASRPPPRAAALLADRQRVHGPDHPHTLTTHGNLARWLGEAGDPAGAATAFEALLADQLRVLTKHRHRQRRGERSEPPEGQRGSERSR